MAKSGDKKPRSNSRHAHYRLTKRVTERELTEFHERALSAGYGTAQAYLTAFIAGREGIGAEVRKDYTEIFGHVIRVGANLNQLAAAVNSGRVKLINSHDIGTINATYAHTRALAAFMRSKLTK